MSLGKQQLEVMMMLVQLIGLEETMVMMGMTWRWWGKGMEGK